MAQSKLGRSHIFKNQRTHNVDNFDVDAASFGAILKCVVRVQVEFGLSLCVWVSVCACVCIIVSVVVRDFARFCVACFRVYLGQCLRPRPNDLSKQRHQDKGITPKGLYSLCLRFVAILINCWQLNSIEALIRHLMVSRQQKHHTIQTTNCWHGLSGVSVNPQDGTN